METVAVERVIDTSVEEVQDVVHDVEAFMRAAGFDHVKVEENRIVVANQVGPKTIELQLETIEDFDGVLAYRQVDGIFKSMETRYQAEANDGRTRIKAITYFELDVAVVGSFLDSTVIKMQRKRELDAQLDYLEDTLA